MVSLDHRADGEFGAGRGSHRRGLPLSALGRRGYAAPVVRGSWAGHPARLWGGAAAEDLLLIVQCEHAAMPSPISRALAGTDGVDMVFIAPMILPAQWGCWNSEAPAPACGFRGGRGGATQAAGKWLDSITGPGRSWSELSAKGYGLVVGPNDVSFLIAGAPPQPRRARADRSPLSAPDAMRTNSARLRRAPCVTWPQCMLGVSRSREISRTKGQKMMK